MAAGVGMNNLTKFAVSGFIGIAIVVAVQPLTVNAGAIATVIIGLIPMAMAYAILEAIF